MISPEKHEFFDSMGHLALTYDDVKNLPGPTDPPAPDVHWSEFFGLAPAVKASQKDPIVAFF